jgi:hypothetical protein
MARLAEHFEIQNAEELMELNITFLKSPFELRQIAYDDPDTAIAVIEAMGKIEGLYDVADLAQVTSMMRTALEKCKGEERLQRVLSIKDDLESAIAVQREYEDSIVLSDTEKGRALQDERIMRRRFIADGIDGATFRAATNNGAIVNPDYLLDTTYYRALGDEPEVSLTYKLGFLKHMMGGHWALGQDHTFLFRNSGEGMAAAQTGVVPDYAAIRPGNFLFHDLKLLEHGPFKDDFPTATLFYYVRKHYLEQMDLTVLDESQRPDPGKETFDLFFKHGSNRYVAPLGRNEAHVIPFRALKKSESDEQYYEYGEECYIAELVDIALQLDMITTQQYKTSVGSVPIGPHAMDLLRELYYPFGDKAGATALAIEQLLFMHGQTPVGGRDAVEGILSSEVRELGLEQRLSHVKSLQEYNSDGTPQSARAPLTCYYEWFQRFARPVNRDELRWRGIPEV